jgi:hypothetical protein
MQEELLTEQIIPAILLSVWYSLQVTTILIAVAGIVVGLACR